MHPLILLSIHKDRDTWTSSLLLSVFGVWLRKISFSFKMQYVKKKRKQLRETIIIFSPNIIIQWLILKLRMKEGIFSTLSYHAWLPILMSSSRTKPTRAILKEHGEGVPTQNIHTKMKSSKQTRKLKRANLEILSKLACLRKSNKTIL